jgi:hypothetical protein
LNTTGPVGRYRLAGHHFDDQLTAFYIAGDNRNRLRLVVGQHRDVGGNRRHGLQLPGHQYRNQDCRQCRGCDAQATPEAQVFAQPGPEGAAAFAACIVQPKLFLIRSAKPNSFGDVSS